MTPLEELDLILILIKKYHLPLSPILEYAVNEKKDEFIDNLGKTEYGNEKVVTNLEHVPEIVFGDDATIELTRELIESAKTPNGGFTKNQLAALGIAWPAPKEWIEDKIGTFISKRQLEDFKHIEYEQKNNPDSTLFYNSNAKKTYKDIAWSEKDLKRLVAVLNAIEHFEVPVTSREVARTVSRSAWGGTVQEDSVDIILKRLPEVEQLCGNYILKSKKK